MHPHILRTMVKARLKDIDTELRRSTFNRLNDRSKGNQDIPAADKPTAEPLFRRILSIFQSRSRII